MQKATRRQYNRVFGTYQAILTSGTTEPVCSLVCAVVEKAKTQSGFEPHELYEMALAYGLKHGFVSVGEKTGKHHFRIYFTPKGYEGVQKEKKRTCIFTGKRI